MSDEEIRDFLLEYFDDEGIPLWGDEGLLSSELARLQDFRARWNCAPTPDEATARVWAVGYRMLEEIVEEYELAKQEDREHADRLLAYMRNYVEAGDLAGAELEAVNWLEIEIGIGAPLETAEQYEFWQDFRVLWNFLPASDDATAQAWAIVHRALEAVSAEYERQTQK